jgi:hypothetical protein
MTKQIEMMLEGLNSKVEHSMKTRKSIAVEDVNDLIGSLEQLLKFKESKDRQKLSHQPTGTTNSNKPEIIYVDLPKSLAGSIRKECYIYTLCSGCTGSYTGGNQSFWKET